jgi:hypothetical protein
MGPARTYTAIDGSNNTSPIKYASNDGLVQRALADNETSWNFTVVASLAEATQNYTYGNETTGNGTSGNGSGGSGTAGNGVAGGAAQAVS